MKMKSDYRRKFKNNTNKELEESLRYYKNKLIDNIGISESNTDYFSKNFSYIKSLLNKRGAAK